MFQQAKNISQITAFSDVQIWLKQTKKSMLLFKPLIRKLKKTVMTTSHSEDIKYIFNHSWKDKRTPNYSGDSSFVFV